ncbi:MAG: hypothetical protein MI741_05420, partial [Rhodospirillales bacterium]|nr:hypothetical protein [Rhodospirillales bacterium]
MRIRGLLKSEAERFEPAPLRLLASLIRPYAGRTLLAVGTMILLAVLNIIMPAHFLRLVIDQVFPNRDWSLLWKVLIGILLVYAARNLLYFIGKYTAVSMGEQVCFQLRQNLFIQLQAMNMRFYRK